MNATTCTDDFDSGGMIGLKVAEVLAAILSVFGSGFIMTTWYLQKGTRRSLGMHIIFCLSLADFGSSFVHIVDGLSPTGVLAKCGGEAGGFCGILAALSQFFGLAAILWTMMIAIGLHLGVLRRSKLATQTPAKLRTRMHCVTWGGACLSLLIMIMVPNTLGPTGQWCWIRKERMVSMGLTFYYLPLICVLLYSIVIYGLTRRTLFDMQRLARESTMGTPAAAEQSQSSAQGTIHGLTSRLRAFLLVFGVIHACQLTNRLWDIAFPYDPSYILTLLQAFLGPLQGLGNAFAYGWSPATRRVWHNAFPTMCACAAAQEEPRMELAPPTGLHEQSERREVEGERL